MTLAFFLVDNSLDYDRCTFDAIDEPSEILNMLEKLHDYEWRMYDTETFSWRTKWQGLEQFMEDYNDEELDGGWWCIVF